MSMSFPEVKRADRNYWYFFGDLYTLMLNAGTEVAKVTEEEFGMENRVLVICGRGNNGGDGLVAASALSDHNEVAVAVIGGIDNMKTSESRRAARAYSGRVVEVDELDTEIRASDIIIDAMLGSGITGSPRDPYPHIVEAMNSSGKKIVSVDVPTGLGWDRPVKPDVTVTFTDVKDGMTEENSGKISVRDIGLPEKVFSHNGPGNFAFYSLPGRDSHKGMNGTVALVSGWTYYGSAAICGKGASRSGADLVRIYTAEDKVPVLSTYGPDLIVKKVDRNSLSEIRKNDSVVIGPGLGRDQDMDDVVSSLKDYRGTLILDAEGLQLLGVLRRECPHAAIIITPHKGEFRELAGNEPSQENARAFAGNNSCTVLLKGSTDIVTDGTRTRYTEGGNPRMTMGGTGDLLAGIAASVSARVEDPFEAACLASFICKRAGELAFRQNSYWYDINDMLGMLPEVMKLALLSR